jgi:aminoglycoside phosphotransferase (APT) family kinase protein
MESSSKLKLEKNQLAEIVQNAFGGKISLTESRENREGWFNALYALSFSDGSEAFLKVAPPESVPCLRYEKNIIRTEIEVLRIFRDHREIPSPEILFADDSRSIIDADYFIMEKLAGDSYSSQRDNLDKEAKRRLDTEKGRISREINLIRGDAFGLFGSDRPRYTSWKEAFLQLVDDILADGEDFRAPLPLSSDEFRKIFRDRSDCLDRVSEPALIHWDLHDGNILVDKEGRITGIIDCDRAMWGDPAIEFYHSALFPPGEGFYDGYGEDAVKEKDFSSRRRLYDLYLTMIFVIECESRNVADPGHREWAQEMLARQLNAMGLMFL